MEPDDKPVDVQPFLTHMDVLGGTQDINMDVTHALTETLWLQMGTKPQVLRNDCLTSNGKQI